MTFPSGMREYVNAGLQQGPDTRDSKLFLCLIDEKLLFTLYFDMTDSSSSSCNLIRRKVRFKDPSSLQQMA